MGVQIGLGQLARNPCMNDLSLKDSTLIRAGWLWVAIGSDLKII
jgi:hypothetical protein